MLVLSKEFLDIQATIECGFTLKRVDKKIRTYSQMHRIVSTHNTAQSFNQFGWMAKCSFTN